MQGSEYHRRQEEDREERQRIKRVECGKGGRGQHRAICTTWWS